VIVTGHGGVGLAVTDFGGPADRPPVLLLHGLMGRASTWWADAAWLRGYGRVVAREYFGADGAYFTEVMAEGADGYRPLSRPEVLLAAREHWDDRDHRPELGLVRCPALVVAGARTDGDVAGMREMAELLPDGRFALVDDAGHVVHWDNPDGWRAAVAPFVRSLVAGSGPRG
jgi:pimeloyl-ACP methyl ester carboxylesterase